MDDISRWQQVPDLVRQYFDEALPVAKQASRIAAEIPDCGAGGRVYYDPQVKQACLLPSSAVNATNWQQAWPALRIIDEQPSADWILVKSAGPAAATGGSGWSLSSLADSRPLSTAIVGSLLTGGAGYLGGTVLEHLFPERFVRRGRLRKTLGLLGLGLGAIPGALNTVAHRRSAAEAGQPMGWLEALTTADKNVPVSPRSAPALESQRRLQDPRLAIKAGSELLVGELPLTERRSAEMLKAAFAPADGFGGTGLRPVPVDAFNQAIWNDVRKGMTPRNNPYGTKSPWGDNTQPMHTPANYGAAASGVVSGVQSLYGGQSVLSPRHFIKGLATAGTDVATAHVVGGALGALGGLTPEAQNKLQDIGLWGGMIRGIVGSLFGG